MTISYLNAASSLLDLPILPEHYDDVRVAFETLMQHAALLAEFELPEDTEAAPRFTP